MMYYGFILIIFLTLVDGRRIELPSAEVFERVEECIAEMTRIQSLSRNQSMLSAGCRSVP
jgi:hypothetical protein